MSFFCNAFGLLIKSDIDLRLAPATATHHPDVTILFCIFSHSLGDCTWNGIEYRYIDEHNLILRFRKIGSFWIKSGNTVLINPDQPLNVIDLQLPILGIIIAAVLQQRGSIVLHGSSVLIGGKAVIFLGCKGQGKSTLTGWLMKEDVKLISDDICALDAGDCGNHLIRSAFPKIRINPDVLKYFGDSPGKYPQVHPSIEKRVKDVPELFCTSTKSVGAIYILESGDSFELERLYGVQAVKEILPHLIHTRFPSNQPVKIRQATFTQATSIVSSLPVYRFTRPRDLRLLAEASSKIQSHYAENVIP